MPIRIAVFINFVFFAVTACAASQPVTPDLAQQILSDTWHTDQHVVWELDWPAAPVAGPLTVETWRAGNRYRFEILEAAAPALIGETLVFDGQQAWRYNRFDPPASFIPAPAILSPVSEAFLFIDTRLDILPKTATQQAARVNLGPAKKFSITYPNGDRLILWRDEASGLPARIEFASDKHQITLNARHAEPLLDPPDELFGVGDWVY